MPSPGALKRRKVLKNAFKWIKDKIIKPIIKTLSPLVKKLLDSKFGGSLTNLIKFVKEKVIDQDKTGILSIIQNVVPGGTILTNAIRVASNFIANQDWDKVQEFVESLVMKSNEQEKVIQNAESSMPVLISTKESSEPLVVRRKKEQQKILNKVQPSGDYSAASQVFGSPIS